MTETNGEDQRESFIHRALGEDIQAADIKLSLFQAALFNYKCDSLLSPFPSMYEGDSRENRDYNALRNICEKLPSLTQVQDQGIDDTHLDLLHWVLSSRNITIHSCRKDKYDVIKELTGQLADAAQPTHIFEVIPSASLEEKFEERKAGRKSFYAYHGSRVENFHSILHYGLQSHLNKTSLFGEGTYLSGELSVSLVYAPTGKSWDKSILGDCLGMVAVAEIIDDPSVKCQVKGQENGARTSRARATNSMGGDVPEKYYVVENNDMMMIRYLLVYASTSKPRRSIQPSWVYRNRFVLMMLAYIFMLVAVGLYNSKAFRHQLKRWLR